MTDDCAAGQQVFFDPEAVHDRAGQRLRIVSWNLLRLVGAGVEDVARLIRQHRPDLLVMQEATKELAALRLWWADTSIASPFMGASMGWPYGAPTPFPGLKFCRFRFPQCPAVCRRGLRRSFDSAG